MKRKLIEKIYKKGVKENEIQKTKFITQPYHDYGKLADSCTCKCGRCFGYV